MPDYRQNFTDVLSPITAALIIFYNVFISYQWVSDYTRSGLTAQSSLHVLSSLQQQVNTVWMCFEADHLASPAQIQYDCVGCDLSLAPQRPWAGAQTHASIKSLDFAFVAVDSFIQSNDLTYSPFRGLKILRKQSSKNVYKNQKCHLWQLVTPLDFCLMVSFKNNVQCLFVDLE